MVEQKEVVAQQEIISRKPVELQRAFNESSTTEFIFSFLKQEESLSEYKGMIASLNGQQIVGLILQRPEQTEDILKAPGVVAKLIESPNLEPEYAKAPLWDLFIAVQKDKTNRETILKAINQHEKLRIKLYGERLAEHVQEVPADINKHLAITDNLAHLFSFLCVHPDLAEKPGLVSNVANLSLTELTLPEVIVYWPEEQEANDLLQAILDEIVKDDSKASLKNDLSWVKRMLELGISEKRLAMLFKYEGELHVLFNIGANTSLDVIKLCHSHTIMPFDIELTILYYLKRKLLKHHFYILQDELQRIPDNVQEDLEKECDDIISILNPKNDAARKDALKNLEEDEDILFVLYHNPSLIDDFIEDEDLLEILQASPYILRDFFTSEHCSYEKAAKIIQNDKTCKPLINQCRRITQLQNILKRWKERIPEKNQPFSADENSFFIQLFKNKELLEDLSVNNGEDLFELVINDPDFFLNILQNEGLTDLKKVFYGIYELDHEQKYVPGEPGLPAPIPEFNLESISAIDQFKGKKINETQLDRYLFLWHHKYHKDILANEKILEPLEQIPPNALSTLIINSPQFSRILIKNENLLKKLNSHGCIALIQAICKHHENSYGVLDRIFSIQEIKDNLKGSFSELYKIPKMAYYLSQKPELIPENHNPQGSVDKIEFDQKEEKLPENPPDASQNNDKFPTHAQTIVDNHLKHEALLFSYRYWLGIFGDGEDIDENILKEIKLSYIQKGLEYLLNSDCLDENIQKAARDVLEGVRLLDGEHESDLKQVLLLTLLIACQRQKCLATDKDYVKDAQALNALLMRLSKTYTDLGPKLKWKPTSTGQRVLYALDIFLSVASIVVGIAMCATTFGLGAPAGAGFIVGGVAGLAGGIFTRRRQKDLQDLTKTYSTRAVPKEEASPEEEAFPEEKIEIRPGK